MKEIITVILCSMLLTYGILNFRNDYKEMVNEENESSLFMLLRLSSGLFIIATSIAVMIVNIFDIQFLNIYYTNES